jgi:hypothetical protein
VLHPEGLIVIMEKVEIPELNITPPKQVNFQIPKELAVRHPLFGRGNIFECCRYYNTVCVSTLFLTFRNVFQISSTVVLSFFVLCTHMELSMATKTH